MEELLKAASVQLPGNNYLLNIILGFIMYGVALDITPDDFKRLFKDAVPAWVGLISQFVVLPFLTFCLILVLKPHPSLALGMILVAACPGGNISNFISSLFKGNIALSVGLTAASTALAPILTPLNFSFYAGLYAPTAALLRTGIALNTLDLFQSMLLLLGIPLLLGMLTRRFFPLLVKRIIQPIQLLSLLIFTTFVIVAFYSNREIFLKIIAFVAPLVFVHNLLGLAGGYLFSLLCRQRQNEARTIAIETGIQNSGIALYVIFQFFDGEGGMAVIAAWWGIWHIVSGFAIAWIWSRRPVISPL